MIGLTLATCDPGVSMCLTRASGMGREVRVTLIHDVSCFLAAVSLSRWRETAISGL